MLRHQLECKMCKQKSKCNWSLFAEPGGSEARGPEARRAQRCDLQFRVSAVVTAEFGGQCCKTDRSLSALRPPCLAHDSQMTGEELAEGFIRFLN